MTLEKNFNAVRRLFEALHDLGRDDKPPDSRMVSGVLFCLTNDHLLDLMRFLLTEKGMAARNASLHLSKRSSLFDKLIIMKDDGPKPWVLRLHTYQVPLGDANGKRVSNLGEELQDDEANTHFHRWQLGSRFLTGGFNNVTWDVTDKPEYEDERFDQGELQIKFGIPATAKVVGQQSRKATPQGLSYVNERRSEFYMEGDVIAYPIVDAHSVGAAMSGFVGTTMTLAHTGREELDDSYFFKRPKESGIDSVRQESFSAEEHKDAIRKSITRLQLIALNKYLASGESVAAEAFGHMNSFETELLPRIAELCVLHFTDEAEWDWQTWVFRARSVDLDEPALRAVIEMFPDSLAWLIVASQEHLFAKSFVSKLNHYKGALQKLREFEALSHRLGTGKLPLNARRF